MKKFIGFLLIVYISTGLFFGLYEYSKHFQTFKCDAEVKPHGYITIGSDSFTNPNPSRCKHIGLELKSISTIPMVTAGWPLYVIREISIFDPLENYLGGLA